MATQSPAEELLASAPLFSTLTDAERQHLSRLVRPVTLAPGDVLFRQNDAPKAMWLLSGDCQVRVSAPKPDGPGWVDLATVVAPNCVGEMALMDAGPRSATATVEKGGNAFQLDAAPFVALRAAFEPAAFKVMRQLCLELCVRLKATSHRVVSPSEKPIASPPLNDGREAVGEWVQAYKPFAALPQIAKLALAQRMTTVVLPPVAPVFGEGELADAAYFVVEGSVDFGRNGRTLSTVGPGAMFGMVSLLEKSRRATSAVTGMGGPSRLLRLSARDFDALFWAGHKPAFQLVDLVCRQMVHHVRQANALLTQPRKLVPPVELLTPREQDLPEAEVLPLEMEIETGAAHPVGT